MNTPRATVSKVLTFTCVDGPGNRLVLFLQGCNFACKTCHNPHTMNPCDGCGECVPACHANALTLDAGNVVFDPANCDQCDACLRACPINANPMVQLLGVPEVLDLLHANRAFLDGLTVSGGEATMQLKFLIALFQAVKAAPELRHLTCLIDSNGYLGPAAWDKVLPWTDGVMLDIKAVDDVAHRALTGVGNERVMRSARQIHAAGKLQELRFLVVPGFTDTREEVAALAEFVQTLGDDVPIRLNAFQHHGVVGEAQNWPTASRACVESIAGQLRGSGIANVTTPVVYV